MQEWYPLALLRVVFVVLVCIMVAAGLLTRARPRTAWEWRLVWALLVLMAWALLGFVFLKSR